MNSSSEASIFTNTLLATVRLQRHLGVRVIVSTQEPTISPALLDLSSITIVHRFTSPEWLRSLKGHLAPAAFDLASRAAAAGVDGEDEKARSDVSDPNGAVQRIFFDVVNLQTGEALLFAPSGIVATECSRSQNYSQRLGFSYLKIKIRARLTADGGKSIMSM